MASRHFIYPDIRNRLYFNNKELNYWIIKSFLFEIQLTTSIFMPFYEQVYLQTPIRSRIRNRCLYTGRSRAVLTKYHFSRMVLVRLFSKGSFPGIRKASWN